MSEANDPMTSTEEPKPNRVRRFFKRLSVLLLVLLSFELVGRVVAFAWNGFDEHYLLYGFEGLAGRVGISPWQVYDGSHFKFPPNYELEGAAGQGHETATTNALGFRGPDFAPQKPDDTFRIVCLGGSSTFGYHNNDDETYPHYLQGLLEEEYERIEVVNAGFPYYNTGSIRSLLEAEVWSYEPDLITLYSAYNDACWPLKVQKPVRWIFWLQEHSVLYLGLKNTILSDQRIYWIKNKLHSRSKQTVDPQAVLSNAEGVARRYRANVEAIADGAAQREIPFVLVRQPITTRSKLEEVQKMSYEDEAAYVLDRLHKGEFLWNFDYYMIRHRRLIEEVDTLAAERSLPVVDNIELVDRDRTRLTTWVHLSAEANRELAEALRERLRELLPEGYRKQKG